MTPHMQNTSTHETEFAHRIGTDKNGRALYQYVDGWTLIGCDYTYDEDGNYVVTDEPDMRQLALDPTPLTDRDWDEIRAQLYQAQAEILLARGTRQEIIGWLCWNDRNGIYRDHDLLEEGQSPLTLEECREILARQCAG
jgi:hypothetical protein